MNEYIGKYCPYCKTKFTENDEIVICSQCDMPHHKDCWIDNGGCTTFGCLGTIKSADGSPTTVTSNAMQFDVCGEQTETIYCSRCGAQNQSSGSFCVKCGNALVHSSKPSGEPHFTVSGMNQNGQRSSFAGDSNYQFGFQGTENIYFPGTQSNNNDVALCIGKNSEYYIPKFNEMKAGNKKNSWNWCSFLFAPYWFIYRKMYGIGIGVLVVAFILSLIPSYLLSILSLGGYIALGIFGNYLYMQHIDSIVQQMATMPDIAKRQFASEKGGVNKNALIGTIVGYGVIVLIVNLL
mgnify:CR=1 FL=1